LGLAVSHGAEHDGSAEPLPDIISEARRILDSANANSLPLRLVGGVAIRFHAAGTPHPGLERQYKDIDLVTVRASAKKVSELLTSLGYVPHHTFNTMNRSRALFYDVPHSRQVDVFIDTFAMCHKIPISTRLDVDRPTVPLAELLLTKLQIIELNEKDLIDILALLVDHDVGPHDDDTVNASYIAKLCADDWGLWRTCKLNIARARAGVDGFGLSQEDREIVLDRLERLWRESDGVSKSRRWKLRDRVGDRVRWYEEPEEVA
jgi:Uncharacterised nucleotidyltransferase